eukprot:CAMPEP_0181136374 /NCGR_PEP_ID=MMETSP1071-20121207/33145_1 /TAXON_ID=35127 /ORGANISM="Thalassiosira sp., Strain NH16" /LENGTH=343 /DNA_ID=CAMNT_0023223071 /DNA_START=32 /DNA_END=1063 /DNA_ORIENTATION=-
MRHFILLLSAIVPTKANGWSWSPLSPAIDGAPRVSGQTTASIIDDSNNSCSSGVLLFGGLTGAAGSPTTNDLWHFEDVTEEWTKLSPEQCPRVRMYAASAMLNSKYYIFGGWDPMDPGSGGEFLNDIWSYDMATKAWTEEEAELPFPVSRHAAVAVGEGEHGMVIIHTFKGIFTFRNGQLTEQATEGDAPDSLSMCAMTAVGNKVLLFGGSDKTQQMSSAVHVLDTTNWVWTKLQCTHDDGPGPMASACMAPLSENQCIVFGGAALAPTGYEGGYGLLPKDDTWVCTLSEKNVEWERVECKEVPEGRVAASLNSLGGDRFLMQGGYDPVSKGTFGTPWILRKT